MSRKPRNYQSGFCYHITTRCNNREFRLTRVECREVFLYANCYDSQKACIVLQAQQEEFFSAQ